MTWEIAAVLIILAFALVFFVTEKLEMDVVALLVLSALGVSGLVTPAEALAGFSNPAVITVWSMFILSAGLSATGVADIIGRQVLKIAGKSEPRIIFVIMMTTGILSAFMNNIGVAALMLPVVMDISRQTQTSPSRLLMPMAYSSLLGGLTTLVGTPPNLVASDALIQAGHEGFSLFSFTPIGLPALVLGSLFVAFIGRHILPKTVPKDFLQSRKEAGDQFRFSHDIEQFRFRLALAADSPFDGKTLRESGLSAILGLNVYAVTRDGNNIGDVTGDFVLQSNDILQVQGRREDFSEFLQWQALEMASGAEIGELLSLNKLVLLSAEVSEDSKLQGLAVAESDFHRRFDSHILTIKRDGKVNRGPFANFVFRKGDVIQIEVKKDSLSRIEDSEEFSNIQVISEESFDQIYRETDSLIELDIPEDSHLAGLTVAESGIGDALRLRIIAIGRKSGSVFLPAAGEVFQPGDKLMVHGGRSSVTLMRGLQSMSLLDAPEDEEAKEGDTGFTEVTLSPKSSVAGKTLRELNFRGRYGLGVLSIWRNGRSYGSHLRNFELKFGDAMLLSGSNEKLEALAEDDDFLVLSHAAYESEGKRTPVKALFATLIMLGIIFSVLGGLLPIEIAAIAGAALMVTIRCLTIEKAYQAIEWKSVFLIACMIPLGAAMKETGAAEWLATGVTAVAEPFGPWGLIIGLYVLTMLATTIVPTAALVLIMAHIGMDAAARIDLPPQIIVMAIALAASASFTSPISHPANVLVMGPGGYRFIDYIKMGLILAAMVMATVLPLLYWWLG